MSTRCAEKKEYQYEYESNDDVTPDDVLEDEGVVVRELEKTVTHY